MLKNAGDSIDYLLNYRNGKIKQGLEIGCDLDNYLRFKPKQLNIILGHDNVGKTYWINWYFLNLALKHELTFCIWSGENQKGQILRDLIQMYSGQQFKTLTEEEIMTYSTYLEQYFQFVDNSKLYKPEELLKIFEDSNCKVGLIDPFTGLDRQMTYEGNYEFMNKARQMVNFTGMTLYINTHPNTESGRGANIYTEGEWKGNLKAPLKDHIEGGKAFSNRCDDFFVIHRLVKDPIMKYSTWINVEKIKDVETGGKHTGLNEPVMCNFNSGLGFVIGNVDPLQKHRPKSVKSNSFPTVKPDIVNGKELLSFSERIKQGAFEELKPIENKNGEMTMPF
jgi:hypothetical protein